MSRSSSPSRFVLRRLLSAVLATFAATTASWAAEPQFKPLYDHSAVALVPSRTVHSEGRGVFLENIVALGEGRFAVTSLFDGRILHLAADGRTHVLAQVPGHASGIEQDGAGGLVVGGWTKDERRLLWRVAADGTVSELVALPEAAMPNGITMLGAGVLLVADSVKGLIWRVDIATRAVSVWKADALLGGFRPEVQPAIPAVNGLKRHRGHVYASNMSLNQLVRIVVQPDGSAGAAEVYADNVFADDFAIDDQGRIFATTHAYNSVLRIDTNRRATVIGQRAQGLQGATALAFGRDGQGRPELVVVTNGGVYVPPAWGVEDAKVVRLTLPGARSTR
jgi:sugar lactone lactonase YvrE